ncbi:flagellar biosynthesis protein FlhF [Sutcliffiella deserti]|uniref:flagellar biosynthesis protein FlhF n=1 Tax=Sutcliffiella deserti TaxID=2875501 RepID=UPI001CBF0238|nr:flagellar biosynthesis protein FlhF [Sutcliffiella deserti]
MKVKKYKASTMQEAMNLVRLELGDQAVILNSKAVKTSKFFGLMTKKSVEVIAAIDEEPVNKIVKVKADLPKEYKIDKEKNTLPVDSGNSNEIMASLQEMKRMMRGFATENKRDPQLPDFFYELEGKIKSTDLSGEMIEEAIEELYKIWFVNKDLSKTQMIKFLQSFFLDEVKNVNFNQNMYKKKFISLVGPTGVGKTTTLAKLAANAVLKQGKSVGFITTDTYRIAAIDQLKTYASILDAPIEVCYNAADFQEAKNKLAHLDVIFIDTAGRNFLNKEFVSDLKAVINFEEEMDTFLVLSLTSKLKDMKIITEQFWEVGIQQFLFTKKDETTSVSSMYSLIHHYQKGASYLTNGQSVPEDLIAATKETVVDYLIEEIK